MKVNNKSEIAIRDLTRLPNLISLLRVFLTPVIGYFLWLGHDAALFWAVIFLAMAGLTDFFDGFLARKMNQITSLGIMLDPLADKLFALVLVVELVIFRGFPLWLAAAIILRDLIFVVVGAAIMKGRKLTLPSNLTGKYYFGALFLLIVSYVTRFPSGERFFTLLTVILLTASTVNYGRMARKISHDQPLPVFHDRPLYKWLRSGLTILIVIIGSYKFYIEVITRYLN